MPYPENELTCKSFDTIFRRPYRCFSIVLKVLLSLFDRYKLFTSDWLWVKVCQNVVFSKIDITMTTINKKLYRNTLIKQRQIKLNILFSNYVLTRISRRLHFPSFVWNDFPFFRVINSNSQGVFIVHKHSGSVQSRRRFHLGRLQSGSFVLVVVNLCTCRRTWKRNKLMYNPYKIPKRPAMLALWSTKWR